MIRRFFLSLLLAVLCLGVTPISAVAFSAFGGACNNSGDKAEHAAACSTHTGNPLAGPDGLLLDITRIVAYLAGAIAVIMLIIGSIRFITSGSDVSTGSRTDTDVEEAKRTIAGALVGLAIIIFAQAIIGYVVRRL